MTASSQHRILTIFIASVWLVNGLLCKVLNLVPRHGQIVAEILGTTHAATLTLLIGLAEIVMAAWVLTQFRPKLNAAVQMVVVAAMNVLEFFLVPELLLWGQLNALFALLFIGLVYYHSFAIGGRNTHTTP